MGVSINAHVYNVKTLTEQIEAERTRGDLSAREFLEKVEETYGQILGDVFIVIWNEYYDEYNPAIKFLHIVEKYFGIDDFWPDYHTIDGGADDYELYEEFGLKEDDDEDY